MSSRKATRKNHSRKNKKGGAKVNASGRVHNSKGRFSSKTKRNSRGRLHNYMGRFAKMVGM